MVEQGTWKKVQEDYIYVKHPLPKRAKGLRKLGVSEDDVITAERVLSEIPPPPQIHLQSCSKVEILLGYSKSRLRREKALKVLGANEDEVDQENSKVLGSLGLSGRRRSYLSKDHHPFLLSHQRKQGSHNSKRILPLQKRYRAELRKLRKDVTAQQKQIELLKDQLEALHEELQVSRLSSRKDEDH
jgi:hypothetical protein